MSNKPAHWCLQRKVVYEHEIGFGLVSSTTVISLRLIDAPSAAVHDRIQVQGIFNQEQNSVKFAERMLNKFNAHPIP